MHLRLVNVNDNARGKMKNLKDLKNFKGNLRDQPFGLFPINKRQFKASDIPKLTPEEVNVRALLSNPNGTNKLRPIICTVADLPDTDQLEFILGKVR